MGRRMLPLILVLVVAAYFGHRYWLHREALKERAPFYGSVEAVEVHVSSQVAGTVMRLFVDDGDRAEQGMLLVVIDDALYKAQVAQARAAVRTARKQLDVLNADLKGVRITLARTRKLFTTGSTTQQRLDEIETREAVLKARKGTIQAQVAQAEAALRVAETRLGYTRIRAPLSGRVLRVDVEQGETVFPGSALLTMADLSSVEVKVYVPGPMLGRIRLGQAVDLVTDSYPDRVFRGRVAVISDEAEFTPKNVQTRDERVRLVYAVTVRVPNPDRTLKTGMPVDARFVEG